MVDPKNKSPIKRVGRIELKYSNGNHLTFTVLDTEEEYLQHVEELDEYSFAYLANNPNYSAVYTVTPQHMEAYGSGRLAEFRVVPSVACAVSQLRLGIEKHGFDPKDVPVIPIMEYKLVPTGEVYYFDPAQPPGEEKIERQRWRDAKRHREKRARIREQKRKEREQNGKV